jgi:hypothetical protein
MGTLLWFITFFVVTAVVLVVVRAAALRYEAGRRASGAWGPDGPVHPTQRSPDEPRPLVPSVDGWVMRAALAERDRAQFAAEQVSRREARHASQGASSGSARVGRLRLKRTGQVVGAITSEDAVLLRDELELPGTGDFAFFADADTVAALEREGASAALVTMLDGAVRGGPGEDFEVTRD